MNERSPVNVDNFFGGISVFYLLFLFYNLIDEAVFFGFLGVHKKVALRVFLDFLVCLVGVLCEYMIELVFNF